MNGSGPFSRMAVLLLAVCAVGLFALSMLLHAYPSETQSSQFAVGSNSRSRSALGHAGFYDMLRRMDLPVVRDADNALERAGKRGTVLIIEPDLSVLLKQENYKFLTARNMLVVLPKWQGRKALDRKDWIAEAAPMPPELAKVLLGHFIYGAEIVRAAPQKNWAVNEIGVAPTIREPMQLIRSEKVRPIVAGPQGILLGELKGQGGRVVWILADPDVIENHGLFLETNAAFASDMIAALRDEGAADGPIVFDETIHGFKSAAANASKSPIRLMFQFPFNIVTGLVCIAGALLLWASMGRFGVPRQERQALDFGKSGLIANSARLIDYAGHQAMVMQRYLRMTVSSVANQLHAPNGLDAQGLVAWLDRIGKARGVSSSCSEILAQAEGIEPDTHRNLNRLFAAVQDIHSWKGEVLHGPSTRRRDR